MRFNDLEITKCSYWLEKLNVLFLLEKESKKSDRQWAGRTDSNKWVVFDKEGARIKDFVDVHIDSSYGVALKGHLVAPSEAYHAVA